MAQDLTLAGALDEAKRWVHALRSAEKLESVIAVVLRAETLVADSERALREFNTKIDAKKSELNEATVQLTDVRQRIANEQARLTSATTEANRVVEAGNALRAEAQRKNAAYLQGLADRVREAEIRATKMGEQRAAEIAILMTERDTIKADIEALQRKVAGVS